MIRRSKVQRVKPSVLLTVRKISTKPLCPFVIDLLFKTEGQTQRARAYRRTMQAFESLKAMRARIIAGHRELPQNFVGFVLFVAFLRYLSRRRSKQMVWDGFDDTNGT